MKLLIQVTVAVAMFAALPLYGAPVDLSTAWQKAKEYDARLGAAQADNLIYQEEIGKARAQLRPNVRMNAARGRNATQFTGKSSGISSSYYNSIKRTILGFTIVSVAIKKICSISQRSQNPLSF